jgi:hypothetical protein
LCKVDKKWLSASIVPAMLFSMLVDKMPKEKKALLRSDGCPDTDGDGVADKER